MVNFNGFKKLVDAIGGVDVYCEKSFNAHTDDLYFKKGNLHLNGRQALAFVRERMHLVMVIMQEDVIRWKF